MLKKRLFKIYYFVALIIVLVNSVYLIKSDLFFDIENLPEGEYLYSVNSPDNLIKLDVFRIKNSVGSAIRVSAAENAKNGKSRNVYWQTDIDKVNLEWKGNSEIEIDEMPINITEGGYYDCRRGLSIILAGSLYSEDERK